MIYGTRGKSGGRWAMCAVLAAGTATALAAAPAATNAPPRVLRIAAEEYPPLHYDERGTPKGACVELMGRILTRLHVPYEIRFYPFTRLWMLMERGKVDAAPSISYKANREAVLYFTEEQKAFDTTGAVPADYLWMTEYVFFVNSKYRSSLRFDSYEQIKADGYRVGVNARYSYDRDFLAAGLKTVTQVDPRDSFNQLSEGRIDLYPMDRIVGMGVVRDMGLSDRIAILPRPLFRKPYLMCFSRVSDYPGMEALMGRFYEELRRMRDSGEYERVMCEYVPPGDLPEPVRPLLFVCEEWPPYEYPRDGGAAGIDAVLLSRIMARLKLPYEIKFYPWPRAWLMAQNGAADAVLSISYAEERERYLYYTEEQRKFAQSGVTPPDYLWLSEYVFFVMKKNAGRFRFESYDQIKADGLRVGVNRGYTYHAPFLEAQFGTLEFSSVREGLEALVAGKVDLYPVDKNIGLAQLKGMGLHESVTYLPKPLFSKPYLAPFVRGSDYPGLPSVMQAFNAELRRMRASGEYQKIVEAELAAPPAGP